MPSPRKNEKQSDFVNRCVPYVIDEGTAKTRSQAVAICYSLYRRKRSPVANARRAGRVDPSRTTMLRQRYIGEMRARFRLFKRKLRELVEEEDAFGLRHRSGSLTVMTRWMPLSSEKQLEEFMRWTEAQSKVITGDPKDLWMRKYVEEAYRKGATRTFDDVRHPELAESMDFYQGTRREFLMQAFGSPPAVEKINLLAMRNYSELKGVTQDMSKEIARELVDGMAAGKNPREVARSMSNKIASIERRRAEVIARTETIRAHAEGQLDAMVQLGVTEVGVMVEWNVAGDDRVCPLCADLDGIVLKIDEARGSIPRHPNCRCIWIPANIGEDRVQKETRFNRETGKYELVEVRQKRTKGKIDRAIKRSKKKGVKDWSLGKPISKIRPKDAVGERISTKAKRYGSMAMKAANAGPTLAEEVAKEAGASPGLAKLAMVAATIGDFSVPGVPVGSAVIIALSSVKSPGVTYRVARGIIGRLMS